MSSNSTIEWTNATWNPVRGCTKISAGCKNCYAERFAERWRGIPGHPFEQGFDLRLVPEKLGEPLKWKKPQRIFVNSVSDLFHKDVPFEYVERVWDSMFDAPQHTYQILTKRAKRMLEFSEWMRNSKGRRIGYPQVHLGVSVENQAAAEERIPYLLQVPAAVRFISGEPLLGAVNLRKIVPADDELGVGYDALTGALCGNQEQGGPRIHWVIAGGESGPGARPMHPDWARSLRDQCKDAGIPFFFKQWGEWAPLNAWDPISENQTVVKFSPETFENTFPIAKLGKKMAGRILDGRTWNEFPEAP